MLRSIQSVLSVGYLKSSKLSSESSEIESFLEKTYKNIIDRKNSDGSFRFKGYGPLNSTWLTSLVVKCLGQNGNLMTKDDQITKNAFESLQKRQYSANSVDSMGRNLSGSFRDFASEVKVDVFFTAFVLSAFLEHPKIVNDYRETVEKALSFIDQNSLLMTTNLEIAISAYVMSLAGHKSADIFLQHLEKEARTEGDKKYWNLKFDDDSKKPISSQEIEIACYAFLAFAQVNFHSYQKKSLIIN